MVVSIIIWIFAYSMNARYLMKKIGVFCSASTSVNSQYADIAKQLGTWIGKNNYTLVYGGANVGLMGYLSEATHRNNGKIIGVIPFLLKGTEKESTLPQERIYTQSLSDRKDILLEKSDYIIALPGGIGSLDEIFHVMGLATLGYHHKKVILYNSNGFYNQLLDFLANLEKQTLLRQPLSSYLVTVNNLKELIAVLD